MRPEVKAKWLGALRSGEYKQGQGALRNQGDEFCCLGVLCDLYIRETGAKWEAGVPGELWAVEGQINFPPDEVVQWAELGWKNPEVQTPLAIGGYISLSFLNDGEGPFQPQPFSAIAVLIEEQL